MTSLERYGYTAASSTLRPADFGVKCKESEVIDIATELGHSRSLTSLDLTDASVSPEAAKALGTALGKNSTSVVVHLCVGSCDIHAEGASVLCSLLAGNARLEVLDMRRNPLRDDGAAAVGAMIAASASLRALDVSSCKIGPSGARALGAALATNTRLRSLQLADNKLRCAGIVALVDGLKRNIALRVLDISGNSINAEGGKAIAELIRASPSLESINLARNYLSDSIPAIGHALSTRRTATRLLDLSCNKIDSTICRDLARILEGNRFTVACLSLEDNAIGDDGMVPLYHAVKGTGIQFLDISSCGLTHHSGVVVADLIASCKQLNSVQLDGNPLGDAAGVEIAVAFGRSQALTSLNLERTGIAARTMAALAEALRGPRSNSTTRNLNLSENPGITSEALLPVLHALGAQTALEELDLSSLAISESEEMLRAIVHLFAANKVLAAVLLEHTTLGGMLPQSLMTRDTAASLLRASGGNDADLSLRTVADASTASAAAANRTTKSSLAGTLSASSGPAAMKSMMNATNTSSAAGRQDLVATANQRVGQSKLELSRHAQTIFKPAWALSVPLDPPRHDDDAPEDGSQIPLVPHPASLHHPLYPGYGHGRFNNGTLIQSFGNPLPYNVAVSHGTRRRFAPTADGSDLVSAPPRKPLSENPYSLHALENNPCQLPITDDQLRRKFSELDVDGNGYLDREEFKALYVTFQSFGLPMSKSEADSLFNKYCGSDDKVQFDEFSILMLKLAAR